MRVGMLAPMDIELQPLLRKLALRADGPGVWVGTAGAVDVVAMPTMIGMAAATTAARRMLERDVDHMMIVKIKSSDCIFRFRLLRLLFQAECSTIAVKFHNSVALRIVHRVGEDLGAGKGLGGLTEALH